MYFLEESGFYKKFPIWENHTELEKLKDFDPEKKIVPQDILDAIIFAISEAKDDNIIEQYFEKTLPRLEELARWIVRIEEDQLFEIPSSDEINRNLKNKQPPHKYKAFESGIFFLYGILGHAETNIINYLKEDCTYEIKLYRDICVRTVEYIAEMLPNSLGYDKNEVKRDYTFALENFMDWLAWKNLGVNESFRADDFIDCWNINDFFDFQSDENDIKGESKRLGLAISASLEILNMPNISIFLHEQETRDKDFNRFEFKRNFINFLHNKKTNTSDKVLSDYEDIVKYYLDNVACYSRNIRQILWAVEGRKVQDNIRLFYNNFYWLKEKQSAPSYIAEHIFAGILDGFKCYFDEMLPARLWLRLTHFHTPVEQNDLLGGKYPLADIENKDFLKKKREENIRRTFG